MSLNEFVNAISIFPLIIYSLSFILVILFIILSHKRIRFNLYFSYTKTYKLVLDKILLALLFISSLTLLFFGVPYVQQTVDYFTYFFWWMLLIGSLGFTYFTLFKPLVNGLLKKQEKGKFFIPIENVGTFTKWLIIIFIIFFIREAVQYLVLGIKYYQGTYELIFQHILYSVLFVPIAEETVFRWLPNLIWGHKGIIFGTLIWCFFHPLLLLWNEIPYWEIFSATILIFIPTSYFYIRLWKGKYFWATYLIHMLENLLIILFGAFLSIPS